MKKITILLTCLTFFGYGANAAEYELGKNAFLKGTHDLRGEVLYKDAEDNILTGQIVEYYEGGKIKNKFYVKDGKRDGVHKMYYEDGGIALEEFYKDGELHDAAKAYHENGKIAMVGAFKDGKPDGVFKIYYENGELGIKEVYENGKLIESWKRPFCDKQLVVDCLKETDKSAHVIGIMRDGVIVSDDKSGTPKKWFLYTDKKYATDDLISSVMYYKYVGTYEYQQPDGSLNRLHAFKETDIFQR